MLRAVTFISVLAMTWPASAGSWALVSWVGYEGEPQSAYVYLLKEEASGWELQRRYELPKVLGLNCLSDPPLVAAVERVGQASASRREDILVQVHLGSESKSSELRLDTDVIPRIHFAASPDSDLRVILPLALPNDYMGCTSTRYAMLSEYEEPWRHIVLRGRDNDALMVSIDPMDGEVRIRHGEKRLSSPWHIPVGAFEHKVAMRAVLEDDTAVCWIAITLDSQQIFSIAYKIFEEWDRYFLSVRGDEWKWLKCPVEIGGFHHFGRYLILQELTIQGAQDAITSGRILLYDESMNFICGLSIAEGGEVIAITDEEWLVRQGDGIYSGRLERDKLELTKLVEQPDMKDVHWAVPLPVSEAGDVVTE